jgi:hypothetical protein
LKIGFWNVRGILKKEKQHSLFNTILATVDILFLQETRLRNEEAGNDLADSYNVKIYADKVKNGNRSNAVIEKPSMPIVESFCMDSGGDCTVQSCVLIINGQRYGLINVHAPNCPKDFPRFMKHLRKCVERCYNANYPIILLGDFNLDYRSPRTQDRSSKKALDRMLNKYDMAFPYHYNHGRTRENYQIDLVFMSTFLLPCVRNISTFHYVGSDHGMVVLEWEDNCSIKKMNIWKLNPLLLNENDRTAALVKKKLTAILQVEDIVPAWFSGKEALRKIFRTAGIVKSGRMKQKLLRYQELYNDEMKKVAPNTAALTGLREKIEAVEKDDYEAARLRSKQLFIETGEKPTKYFCSLEKSQQRQKSMNCLVDERGREILDPVVIQQKVKTFYEDLYSAKPTDKSFQSEFLELLKPMPLDTAEGLNAPITALEVEEAIKRTPNESSPGPDGFGYELYKFFPKILSAILAKVFNAMLKDDCILPTGFGLSLMSLLFKKDDPRDIRNWRPISLSNTDEKLLSRILASRLGEVLPSLVGKQQAGFVKNRETSDVIIHVQHVIRYLKRQNTGAYLALVDFEKAYDTVDHDFLFLVLNKLGVGDNFVLWISRLYEQAKVKVKVDRSFTEEIAMKRGVRQGCPISPLLFNLVVECLALSINQSKLEGIKHPHFDTKILQFADDTSVFLKNQKDLEIMLESLVAFEAASGLKVNAKKTKLLRIGVSQEPLVGGTKYEVVNGPELLLGVPVGNKISAMNDLWNPLLAKIGTAMTRWSCRKLTLIGKATVINTLLLSKLWYRASMELIPKKVRTRLKKMIKSFLFDKGKAWTTKKPWTAPVSAGGLGILPLKTQNEALLAKIASKLYWEEDRQPLWCQLAKWELGRLGRQALNTNYTTRSESTSHYWRDLKLSYERFVEYTDDHATDLDSLLSQPIALHLQAEKSTHDLFLGDLWNGNIPRCWRCFHCSVVVSQHTLVKLHELTAPLISRFDIPLPYCTHVQSCKLRFVPLAKLEALPVITVGDKSYPFFQPKLGRQKIQQAKWPPFVCHSHWKDDLGFDLEARKKMILRDFKSLRVPNSIKCLRWKIRNNMIPRCFGRQLRCIFCQVDMWTMEHIWIDCSFSQQLLQLLKTAYTFDCCNEDILFGYQSPTSPIRNKVNILLGFFIETVWSEFWLEHFDHRSHRSVDTLLIVIRSRLDSFLKLTL